MTEKPKGQPVKLTITSCVVGWQGINKRGDETTIYEIQACRENGEVISDKKLRSFEELPTGELLDLTVAPYESEKYGLSYTLSRKNRVGSHQRVNEMGEAVQALAQRLDVVERWIAQQGSARVDSSPRPVPLPANAPAQAPPEVVPTEGRDARQEDLDQRFGSTPPF